MDKEKEEEEEVGEEEEEKEIEDEKEEKESCCVLPVAFAFQPAGFKSSPPKSLGFHASIYTKHSISPSRYSLIHICDDGLLS